MPVFFRYSYIKRKAEYLVVVYEAAEYDAYNQGLQVDVLDVDVAKTPDEAKAKGERMIATRSWETRQ